MRYERWRRSIAALPTLQQEQAMSTEVLPVEAKDRAFIDGTEEVNLNDWANRFGVTKEQLRTAIDAVGGRVTDVEAYLASHVTVSV
jgi:hypothetical protein